LYAVKGTVTSRLTVRPAQPCGRVSREWGVVSSATVTLCAVRAETAFYQWDDGLRRLAQAPAGERRKLDHVCDRLVDELRRRLGGSFTTAELAGLYAAGTDWTLPIAVAGTSGMAKPWDPQVLADAAFARYGREALDYAGGRRQVGS